MVARDMMMVPRPKHCTASIGREPEDLYRIIAFASRRIAVTCRRNFSHSFVQTPDR
jgi:hypothetical protein